MSWIADAVVALFILGIAYALASEGCFGAAVASLNVLFSCLIAVNFYEPLAGLIAKNADALAPWADMLCLGLLFLVSFAILKFGTEALSPNQLRLPSLAATLGRLVFGLFGGALTVAFLLLLLYTAPITRRIGGMDYDHQPPFKLGVDRKLLAFLQYTTGTTFPWYEKDLPEDPAYGKAKIFDPKGAWLIEHQNARPLPTGDDGKVPAPEAAAPSPAEAAAQGPGGGPAGGGPAGGGPGGGRGGMRGMQPPSGPPG
jgi:hypothetical protein